MCSSKGPGWSPTVQATTYHVLIKNSTQKYFFSSEQQSSTNIYAHQFSPVAYEIGIARMNSGDPYYI